MADPFEVRMRFTTQLQHLSASTTSAQKTAQYALKYKEFNDDLHSCILEQLERNNLNLRANIMYFLPSLCDLANAQREMGYIRMMERDILRIIDLVAPDDGTGAANVKVVRKVLAQLQGKGFLQPQTVLELEECIQGRDNNVPEALTPEQQAVPTAPGEQPPSAVPSTTRNTPQSAAQDPHKPVALSSGPRLDKRQIEQRIEEDRERHKRLRENIWAIPQDDPNFDAEVTKLWEDNEDANEDVYFEAREEMEGRRKCVKFDYE